MTLRTRLIASLAALLAVLGIAGGVVTVLQRGYMYNQLDQQLERVAELPGPLLSRLIRSGGTGQAPPAVALTDMYVGVIRDGELTTLLAPTDDPDLVPSIDPDRRYVNPATAGSASGNASHVRVITAELANGRVAVFAITTGPVDDASARAGWIT